MEKHVYSNNMNALKSSAYTRARILEAHALLKRTLITCNGKYTEDFRGKTETKEKEACCFTSSRIPGSV